MKKYLLLLALGFMVLPLMGQQQFTVGRFRALSNDISAYINPVKDLNDEACALVKVVGEPDYAFSTPLGIASRKDEVGEIWLYVPKGTILLTIKHPRWGVLRDYRFPTPLESRLTYELILNKPLEPTNVILKPLPYGAGKLKTVQTTLPNHLPLQRKKQRKRPPEPRSYYLMPSLGIHKSGAAFGMRAGVMRRHGVYLHATTNFKKRAEITGPDCDRNGLWEEGSAAPYYTGVTYDNRYLFTAGFTHRIYKRMYLYEGIGYGNRLVVWETVEGVNCRNKDFSAKGIAGEAGLMMKLNTFVFTLGASTINAQLWEATIGIGVHF